MSTKSLLVVEDEVLVARDIKARLERMGYHVAGIAGKGREAIEKALSLRPDLVLMDINLRDDIDGVEAAIRIRQQYDVPVIFCTAYSNEDTLERAKISEPYGYVLKPFDNRELEINIEIALYKHRVEKDLADTRRRLDATLTSVNDGVIAVDLTGEIYLINPMAEKITGWSRRRATQVNLPSVMQFQPFEAAGETFDTANLLNYAGDINYMRQYLKMPAGSVLPIELSVNRIENHEADLLVLTFRDISQQLSYEEQIRHNAFFDGLTGLPNRALFFDRLESSINRRKRGNRTGFAVAFLDIDGFGKINEGLGHDSGDKVINTIATRLESTVRPDDTVSRFSGDVFAVLLDPTDAVTGAMQAVNRMQRAIEASIDLGTQTVNVTASAGIVVHQESYHSPEEMIRDAETALHRAKESNVPSVVFDSEMYRNALRFIEYKSGIQQSISEGSFEMHYQPIIDVNTEALVSMEALVRWRHPDRGYISPAEFIPIAEETGLILPLGEWVLQSVCHQVASWQQDGLDPRARIAVNLSARQFETNVTKVVTNALDVAGISPDSLTLEITEGIAMRNVDRNIEMLNELRFLGLNISIDDFGTGYSSLAYLKRFPLNTLKIDRSFIKDITTNDEDWEITRAIIAMGQNLRLKVLAEGVETGEQVDILRDSGCDYIQGYYYSKPLPADEMTNFLRRSKVQPAHGNRAPPSTSRVAPVI